MQITEADLSYHIIVHMATRIITNNESNSFAFDIIHNI